MTDVRPTCAECRHSRMAQQLGATGLICTRHPAVLHLLPGKQPGAIGLAGLWPPIDPTDGCGEFAPPGVPC